MQHYLDDSDDLGVVQHPPVHQRGGHVGNPRRAEYRSFIASRHGYHRTCLLGDPGWRPRCCFWLGENILFASGDFLPPFRTPVWDIVDAIRDEQIRRTAEELRLACAPGWRATGSLEQLLTGTVTMQIPPAAHPTPIYDGPFWRPPDTTWWEDEPSTPSPLPAPPSKVEPSATRQPTSPERDFTPTLEDWHPPAAGPVGPPRDLSRQKAGRLRQPAP